MSHLSRAIEEILQSKTKILLEFENYKKDFEENLEKKFKEVKDSLDLIRNNLKLLKKPSLVKKESKATIPHKNPSKPNSELKNESDSSDSDFSESE